MVLLWNFVVLILYHCYPKNKPVLFTSFVPYKTALYAVSSCFNYQKNLDSYKSKFLRNIITPCKNGDFNSLISSY